MKKFLIFLVSIVVVVCVGLTTYYFVRNNEIITIKTKEIYCNAGDTISLDSLGINIKNANISKKTTFNYNAGGDEVTKFIKYDESINSYVVSNTNAGDVILKIRTSNNKYDDFTISVHIGNGSEQNPYFVFSETELNKIGDSYGLDKHYILMNDITLTSNFQPIGYNHATSAWIGFNGVFDGRGHIINGLNLNNVNSDNAGLFSSINKKAILKNLTISNSEVVGSYKNVGILAGTIDGVVEKVSVTNSTIINSKDNSNIGSIAGTISNNLKMAFADNVTLNAESDKSSSIDVVIGGLVGKINEATLQACYTNNVNIELIKANAISGGFAGEFVIGTDAGSIQQSYANTSCDDSDYGAFIGKITKASGFNASETTMLKYLIGNIAVVEGKSNIKDNNLVNSYDKNLFVNTINASRSAFYDASSALYLVRGFASVGDIVTENEYIYYAIDANTLTKWDTDYVWIMSVNSLPTLRMGDVSPVGPAGEYLRRDLTQKDMSDKTTFLETFDNDIVDEKVKLLENLDLTSNWTPVAVKNSIIDGNNKTITVNLNKAVNGNLGLFTTIDNSTIKNLNIIIKNISANATNAGGLAGIITSSNSLTTSTIENVTISFSNEIDLSIKNFGGIAGTIEKAVVSNCKVSGIIVEETANIKNIGGLVAVAESSAKIQNANVSATLYGTENVGGVVATNRGSVVGIKGNAVVNYNAKSVKAYLGGIVANNYGVVDNVTLKANVNLYDNGDASYAGGTVAQNFGTISNIKTTGAQITADIQNNGIILIGGVAARNVGKIINVNNQIKNVGTYVAGKNHYVAGIVAINEGSISKVLSTSNLNGNYVSGVVALMNNSKATIDQVVVGSYNANTKTLTANQIKGDKYLAGVSVDFKRGTITNVQVANNLFGTLNTTRASLVTLIFPYGATLKNATIDSSFDGYGITYREVWTDFASFNNKAEFGLENGSTGDERFNVYKYDSYHGIMQSVVINSANNGVSNAKASMGSAFAWGKDYQNTEDSSFIKVVEGFNDVTQFQGSYTFVCSISSLLGIKHKATKTLTFDVGVTWESNNGISLMFLNNIAL